MEYIGVNQHAKAVGILAIGLLFVLNPIYLSTIHDTLGIGYVSSPWLTVAGAVYLGAGLVLLGLSVWGADLTLGRAVIGGLISLPVMWFYLLIFPQSYSTDFAYWVRQVLYWTPQVLPLALMLPLGVAVRRERVIILGIMLLSLLIVFIQPIISPPSHAFGGVILPLIYTLLVGTGAVVLGAPLYFYGQSLTSKNRGSPTNGLASTILSSE